MELVMGLLGALAAAVVVVLGIFLVACVVPTFPKLTRAGSGRAAPSTTTSAASTSGNPSWRRRHGDGWINSRREPEHRRRRNSAAGAEVSA